MQAYLTLGSEKHLGAARNGFDFLAAQSFATGGWGADETLRAPNSDAMFASLSGSHNSFETPCGSYAHFKLTRYLLRVTREARYGDSMERVMYNTVLGAKPTQAERAHILLFRITTSRDEKFILTGGGRAVRGRCRRWRRIMASMLISAMSAGYT